MPNKHFNLIPFSSATKAQRLKPVAQYISIDDIRLRKDADTRPLNAKHVLDLAESIAVLGLLEPLVIDMEGHLLAGGHRLAAIQLLAISDDQQRAQLFMERADLKSDRTDDESKKGKSSAWDELTNRVSGLPRLDKKLESMESVAVLVVDVGSRVGDDKGKRALAIELAENNVRRSYSAQEIRDLAERLKKAGYKASVGRPKAGETSAITVLQAAVGKSKRTIERIIAGEKSNEKSGWQNARTTFKRAAQAIIANGGRQQSPEARKLVALAKKALAILGQDGSQ